MFDIGFWLVHPPAVLWQAAQYDWSAAVSAEPAALCCCFACFAVSAEPP